MKLIEIYNYDGRQEFIRADQIESVVHPGNGPNDNGYVRLLNGRIISFGCSGEARRVIQELLADTVDKV